MDNHKRLVNYAVQNFPQLREAGNPRERAAFLMGLSFETGTTGDLLTPAQRRRVKHKRGAYGGSGFAHRKARRSGREARLRAHWGPAYGPAAPLRRRFRFTTPEQVDALLGKVRTAPDNETPSLAGIAQGAPGLPAVRRKMTRAQRKTG